VKKVLQKICNKTWWQQALRFQLAKRMWYTTTNPKAKLWSDET